MINLIRFEISGILMKSVFKIMKVANWFHSSPVKLFCTVIYENYWDEYYSE